MIRGGIVSRRKASVETTSISANLIYAGPASGAAALPSFRSLVNADFSATLSPSIKNINLSDLSNGYVPYKSSGGLANSPIYTNGLKVGIGTTDPYGIFQIHQTTSVGISLRRTGGEVIFQFVGDGGVNYLAMDTTTNNLYIGGSPAGIGSEYPTMAVGAHIGNVGIGTATPGGASTIGSKVLSIANGTEPVGGRDGQVSLFSKDVSSSAELFVMDEAGNKTQLSPHPTDFLDTLPVADRPFPWAYHSENEYLGKRIKVDLAGLVAAVEQLTGKKFMFVEDIPQRSWDEDQEAQRLAREKEIQNALQQIADLEQKIEAEEDEDKKQELIKQKESIVVPEPYVKKDPPKWIKDRIVITKEATA